MSDREDIKAVVRTGVLVICTAVIGFAIWAYFAPLSGAVIAQGFVKVDLNRKVVQHQEGGIVRAIRVRDGDRVSQGQELVVLDDVRIDSQLDLLRTQLDAERAKAARLEAEGTMAVRPAFPADLLKKEFVAREEALFRARREALDSQVAVLRRQIRETVEQPRSPPRKGRSSCRRTSSRRTSGCSSRAMSRRHGFLPCSARSPNTRPGTASAAPSWRSRASAPPS
jgi:multidrug efflux pump subunit AcrA (membrane-fusion protein)